MNMWKYCPKCGCREIFGYGCGDYTIQCVDCNYSQHFSTKGEAERAWSKPKKEGENV